ncbi:alpha/beta fold hydrolase [Amnibacterium endophyticum]|uniref:Alpha/beta fold hydrolase n=1 Tax=Amnibacterium endophyticum TaxID=2109337 RepID=A0ABW4LA25_9MICO
MTGARLTGFESDGLHFTVRDDGPLDGPVVVALHGFPQTSASWAAVTPLLTAAGYRVLAPDQRGYSPGARPQEVRAYAMRALAGDVLALADAAGVERFHLLGHDWGAAVAWSVAGRHAARVASLAAVSVPHPAAMQRALAGRQALKSWYIGAFQPPVIPEALLRVRGGVLARRLLASTGMRDTGEALRLLTDPRAATALLNWYRAIRLRGQLGAGRIRVPTLFVWSDGDSAIGRRAAEGAGDFVSAPYRFEVFRGTSHWIPEERPQQLAALVLEHLAAHPI